MPRYIINNNDAQIIRNVMKEGTHMKKNYKRLNSSTVSLPEVAAVVLAASVIATSVGCGTGESELIPTESDTQITVVIESDESETVTTDVTESSASVSESDETVPSESDITDETLETTESIIETTATSGGSSNTTATAKPTTQTSSGNGGSTATTTKPTNTPKPTSTPKPTPDPYKAACVCPDCGRNVYYHSATTKHHDAVTHEEKTVTYDKLIKTFKYTIIWTDNFDKWCSENDVSVPSAPSANGDVIYDNKGNVIDKSGEKSALNSISEKAHDLAANLGFTGSAYSYKTKEIDKTYVNRVEHTNTIVDKEAWDEKIPAGWYCDRCDYYSASVPKYYDDIDL